MEPRLLAYKLHLLALSHTRFLASEKSSQCLADGCRKQFVDSAILVLQINIKGSTDRISIQLNASHFPPSLFQ